MTSDQFEALAELMRMREGPAKKVAKMVMVGGMKTSEAAKVADLEYTAAHHAVTRTKKAFELTKKAAGLNQS